MNVCIVIGKLIEEVDFKFIYNNKSLSIANSRIQLIDGNQVEIFGLDEKADYMYSNLNKNDIILVSGKLVNERKNNKIKIESITKINSKWNIQFLTIINII